MPRNSFILSLILALTFTACGSDERVTIEYIDSAQNKANIDKNNVETQPSTNQNDSDLDTEIATFVCYENTIPEFNLTNTLIHCALWDEDGQPLSFTEPGALFVFNMKQIRNQILSETISGIQWDIWIEEGASIEDFDIYSTLKQLDGYTIRIETEIAPLPEELHELFINSAAAYEDEDQMIFSDRI